MKWQYRSALTQTDQTILFDIKSYVSFLRPTVSLPIHDIFQDALTDTPLFPEMKIPCMSLEEAMAEKMRAALTRTIPAIRDFYDIRYAQQQEFDFLSIRDLITTKVAEVG
jgi:predicted nucleotidyltransferase component of viral defense system